MNLKVNDGTIIFYYYEVVIDWTGVSDSLKEEVISYCKDNWSCDGTNVYCVDTTERDACQTYLTGKSIVYSTNDITPTQAQLDKKTEIDGQYWSRTDVLAQMP